MRHTVYKNSNDDNGSLITGDADDSGGRRGRKKQVEVAEDEETNNLNTQNNAALGKHTILQHTCIGFYDAHTHTSTPLLLRR